VELVVSLSFCLDWLRIAVFLLSSSMMAGVIGVSHRLFPSFKGTEVRRLREVAQECLVKKQKALNSITSTAKKKKKSPGVRFYLSFTLRSFIVFLSCY
jgi:hypothetical protein